MAEARWLIEDKDESEGLVERLVVTGRLTLETPAHFGNGDVSVLTDMPLLRDPLEGKALLTGASIAGALRNYLREYEQGYRKADSDHSRAAHLFGQFCTVKQQTTRDDREQQTAFASLLLVDDALGQPPETELRDGVEINPSTRTAKKGHLYNIELLPAGTTFDLRFELMIPAGHDGGRFSSNEGRDYLVESLAIALHGLQAGHIRLGKRKRRGFGQGKVTHWQVESYQMANTKQFLAWLERPLEPTPAEKESEDIVQLLLKQDNLPADRRKHLTLEATFALDSSLLIRSYSADPHEPDAVQLRYANGSPVLSGTSVAGALRARAGRIANTLELPDGEEFIKTLFGGETEENGQKKLHASRLWVQETKIEQGFEMVQSRVKIDRFTGGAYPGALFSEQPVFGTPETRIKIKLTLIQPEVAEIGLLLMLLKDLWTGDLPLGGEASIGRGRLSGREAVLEYNDQTWRLQQKDDKLIVAAETASALKQYIDALREKARWNKN